MTRNERIDLVLSRLKFCEKTLTLFGRRGKPLYLHKDRCGYLKYYPKINGKPIGAFVHHLVLRSNGVNLEAGVTNHIDGNKLNNCFSNLEIVSIKENTRHAIELGLHKPKVYRVKYEKALVKKARALRRNGYTYSSIAKELNVSLSTPWHWCNGGRY